MCLLLMAQFEYLRLVELEATGEPTGQVLLKDDSTPFITTGS